MMVLLNLLFLAILFGLAVLLVWAAWSLAVLFVAKRKWRAILLGLPVSVGFVILTIAALWFHSTRPSVVFEREFGFPLPADTTVIDSSSFALGNSGSAYIHFHTSPTTLARITSAYGPDPDNFSTNEQPPTWFKPPTSKSVLRFVRSAPSGTSSGTFASEFRRVTYDPATGEAWYFFQGID